MDAFPTNSGGQSTHRANSLGSPRSSAPSQFYLSSCFAAAGAAAAAASCTRPFAFGNSTCLALEVPLSRSLFFSSPLHHPLGVLYLSLFPIVLLRFHGNILLRVLCRFLSSHFGFSAESPRSSILTTVLHLASSSARRIIRAPCACVASPSFST
ncbi:hypothetical protein B0T22DRAFT_70493 [Podospora appendiculata]|uniref:Uncharacterized protein n=1 Tax=Podospora appendiculata TaxID=314037 RepID=A0AAE1CHD4_9PEZI|nr:hypothetical protein B0T22DRAFT_70493 [Podospora appendiculata]